MRELYCHRECLLKPDVGVRELGYYHYYYVFRFSFFYFLKDTIGNGGGKAFPAGKVSCLKGGTLRWGPLGVWSTDLTDEIT